MTCFQRCIYFKTRLHRAFQTRKVQPVETLRGWRRHKVIMIAILRHARINLQKQWSLNWDSRRFRHFAWEHTRNEKAIPELWTSTTAVTGRSQRHHGRSSVWESLQQTTPSWRGEESQPSHHAVTSPPFSLQTPHQYPHTDNEAGREGRGGDQTLAFRFSRSLD